MDALVDTAAAAALIYGPPRLIRVWAYRGKLPRMGRTPDGAPLYRTGDVLHLERDQRHKGKVAQRRLTCAS